MYYVRTLVHSVLLHVHALLWLLSDSLTHNPIQHIAHTHTVTVSKQNQQLFIPHEFAYLNKSVLEGSYGYSAPDTHKHFVLKKRPQASVQLRTEMLQRGVQSLSLSHTHTHTHTLHPNVTQLYSIVDLEIFVLGNFRMINFRVEKFS